MRKFEVQITIYSYGGFDNWKLATWDVAIEKKPYHKMQ